MLLTDDKTERELLDMVIEFPDDDAPRLVIADWYEENGHESRADLIRRQIKNGSLLVFGKKYNGQYSNLWNWRCYDKRLMRAPKHTHKMAFSIAHDVIGFTLDPYVFQRIEVVIRRGFVEEVRIGLDIFVKEAQSIASKHPVTNWVFRYNEYIRDSSGELNHYELRKKCISAVMFGDKMFAYIPSCIADYMVLEDDVFGRYMLKNNTDDFHQCFKTACRMFAMNKPSEKLITKANKQEVIIPGYL